MITKTMQPSFTEGLTFVWHAAMFFCAFLRNGIAEHTKGGLLYLPINQQITPPARSILL